MIKTNNNELKIYSSNNNPYVKYTEDLELHNDVSRVPERFKYVIVDGAMYHTYMFRDNIESAQIAFKKFTVNIIIKITNSATISLKKILTNSR